MRADELIENRLYHCRVTRELVLGAPDIRRPIYWHVGDERELFWRGPGSDGPAAYRWQDGQKVPTAGAFWTSYDIDGALICYFEDVEVLRELPLPR